MEKTLVVFTERDMIEWMTDSRHSPDKEPLSLMIPRTMRARLERAARKSGKKLSTFVVELLASITANWTITAKDYEAIARATKIAERQKKRVATVFDDRP